MCKIAKKIAKITALLTSISAVLVALSMIVYYFNLDMKLTSKLEAPLEWWYDNMVKRDRGL